VNGNIVMIYPRADARSPPPHAASATIRSNMTTSTSNFETRALAAAAALRRHGAREVYFFGSAANGTNTSNSDLDLAVRGLPPELFFAAMARARDAAGMCIDLVDLDDDSPFVRVLQEHGGLRRVA